MSGRSSQLRTLVAAFALLACAAFAGTAVADSGSGGASPADPEFQPRGKATLLPSGLAIAPVDAPPQVKAIIEAGNRIATKPYLYGGGHTPRFRDRGYDCSGSLSYALHGGGLLDSPLDSSSFMRWGERGRGDWVTVFTNPGHAYMLVAGLRFDTSMRTPIAGSARKGRRGLSSRWSTRMRSARGYRIRHPDGL